MAGKRKRYSADFEAKVALEALRGELTTAQLAAKHGVHQTKIGQLVVERDFHRRRPDDERGAAAGND